jgi:hypothetical protein
VEEVVEGLAGGGGGEDEGEAFPEEGEVLADGEDFGGGDAGVAEGGVVEGFLEGEGAELAVVEEGFEAVFFVNVPETFEVEGMGLVLVGGGDAEDVAVAAVVFDQVVGAIVAHLI